MAKFQPGQSGNPKGRPPKERALTAILERAGAKTVMLDGKPISGKRFIAQALWELAATGQTTLPDGRVLKASPGDWLETVKWLYVHIDGPAKQQQEHGGAITVQVVYENPPQPPDPTPDPSAGNS